MFKLIVFLGLIAPSFAGTADYRVGLHTHMGYPQDLSRAYDVWLKETGYVPQFWDRQHLTKLLDHAQRFNPTLLAYGGLSWTVAHKPVRLDQNLAPDQKVISFKNKLKQGSWFFSSNEIFVVERVLGPYQYETSRFGEPRAYIAGESFDFYHAQLHPSAEKVLKDWMGGPMLAQIVLMPPAFELPAPLRRGKTKAHLSQNTAVSFEGDIYESYRYRPPAMLSPKNSKVTKPDFAAFTQYLFRNYLDQIAAAAQRDGGDSIIRWWLLGNEPDSMIPIDPMDYARWLALTHSWLIESNHPGSLALTNINGSNPHFDDWLDQLGHAFEALIGEGVLDSSQRPFDAAAITFYLNGSHGYSSISLDQTSRLFFRKLEELNDLFVSPRPIHKIVKELAFGSLDEMELTDASRSQIRQAIIQLKDLGFDDIVWFNQMPTGRAHGDLINNVIDVEETPLGAFLRRLNQDLPQPLSPSLQRINNQVHWSLQIHKTELGFLDGTWNVALLNANGAILDLQQGFVNIRKDTSKILEGFFDDDWQAAGLRFRFDPDQTGFRHAYAVDVPLRSAEPRRENQPPRRKRKNLRFPDFTLNDLILDQYDKDGDRFLSDSEIREVTYLTIRNENVTDYEGVQNLEFLEELLVVSEVRFSMPALDQMPRLTRVTLINQSPNNQDLLVPPLPTELDYLKLENLTASDQYIASFDRIGEMDLKWIAQLGELSNLREGLTQLTLDGLALQRLTGLPSSLQSLIVYNTPLDIVEMAKTNLTYLKLAGLGEVMLDEYPESMIEIDIQNCSIPKPPEYAHLINLNMLRLNGDIPYVSELPANLVTLWVVDTPVTNLPAMDHTKIAFLRAPDNALAQIGSFSRFTRSIDLTNNQLTSIPDLRPLSELESLDLSQNRFTQIPDVRFNAGLSKFDMLDNPLATNVCDRISSIRTYRRWERDMGGRGGVIVESTLNFSRPGGEVISCGSANLLSQFTDVDIQPAGDDLIISWREGQQLNQEPESWILREQNGALLGTVSTNFIRIPRPLTPVTLELVTDNDTESLSTQIEITDEILAANRDVVYTLAHVPRMPIWSSLLEVANSGPEPARFHLEAMDVDGSLLGTSQDFNLPAEGAMTLNIEDYFFPEPAWLEVRSDQALQVNLSLGLTSGENIAQMPVPQTPGRFGVMPLGPSSNREFNAYAFLNSGDNEAQVRLFQRDQFSAIGDIQLTIPPGQKRIGLFDSEFLDRELDHIFWLSNSAVYAYGLSGDSGPWTRLQAEAQTGAGSMRGLFPQVSAEANLVLINPTAIVNRVQLRDLVSGAIRTFSMEPNGHVDVDMNVLFHAYQGGPIVYESDAVVIGWALNLEGNGEDLSLEAAPIQFEKGRNFMTGPLPPIDQWATTLYLQQDAGVPFVIKALNADGLVLDTQESGARILELDRVFPGLHLTSVIVETQSDASIYRLSRSRDGKRHAGGAVPVRR